MDIGTNAEIVIGNRDWLVCALIGATLWKMPAGLVAASTLSGFGSAVNVLIIVFGAVLILYTLRESGAMETISHGFTTISPDRRVQTRPCRQRGHHREGPQQPGFESPADECRACP